MRSSPPKIVALVPMRHTSQRVPGKNYRVFAGKPLYRHVIRVLLECPEIDQIVIDTDSHIIREDAAIHFPEVMLIPRPEHLRREDTSMNEVLLHDVTLVSADYYLQTHSTNPLITSKTISEAISTFLDSIPEYDSLCGVTRLNARLWTEDGKALNHDPSVLLPTQDLPPVYLENSNLYLFQKEMLQQTGSRLGRRTKFFEIDKSESWDVDEEVDFVIAERLYLAREAL